MSIGLGGSWDDDSTIDFGKPHVPVSFKEYGKSLKIPARMLKTKKDRKMLALGIAMANSLVFGSPIRITKGDHQ